MRKELEKKVEQSIKLLRSVGASNPDPIEVAYSGGKDSDVILQLAKEAGINYRAIYKNTTIDPPGTIKHVREMGVEVKTPEKNFFQLIEQKGFPNMFMRFCCEKLKEYKILDRAIIGVRKSESTRRSLRYNEPTECKFYGNKKQHVEAIYPILDWTDEDVEEFLADRGIKCAPLYYDEDGTFHVERRLGCMCCPLIYYKKRLKAFEQYPFMVKAYIKAGQKYRDDPKHAEAKTVAKYGDVYEWFVREVFYPNQKAFEEERDNSTVRPDYKKYIEDYFNIQL